MTKFNAQVTVVDGIKFHSKAESERYKELKLLLRAGKISGLELQPQFQLHAGNNKVIGKYICDFSYWDKEASIWMHEDVKGISLPLYKWKKKHVEAEYGVTITEIKRSRR